MRITVTTPDGPRVIPDWAKCHCVTRHSPNYIHPYPFALPSGDELWLCPNTYHQAITLLGMYSSLDGPPIPRSLARFNYFVRSLITMYWQQVMEMRETEGNYEAWKTSRIDQDELDLWESVKRLVADG